MALMDWTLRDYVAVIAGSASIITAVVAAWAYGTYRIERRKRRIKLESHLLQFRIPDVGMKRPRRFVHDVMRDLWWTEDEVFQAARDSKKIERGMDTADAPLRMVAWLRLKD